MALLVSNFYCVSIATRFSYSLLVEQRTPSSWFLDQVTEGNCSLPHTALETKLRHRHVTFIIICKKKEKYYKNGISLTEMLSRR